MASTAAKKLRKTPTEAEKRFWSVLRRRQMAGRQFRRQAPIGSYVVDFVCFAEKLIIEVDGGQHAQHRDRDLQRTGWLESQGFRVLRFWNNDVLENLEGVADSISLSLRDTPHPGPPPQGGRGKTA